MKKHLLLILLGFGSFGVVADDEFPIELTCEIGANIVYFNLNETKVGSWWQQKVITLLQLCRKN